MLRTVFKEDHRGGYVADASRESTLEFHVMKVTGKDYVHFRIGRKIAERAGLRPKDKVVIAFDPEGKTLRGEITPNSKGWGLQSVGSTETPPLWLRITYQDGWPYRKTVGQCTDVIAKNGKLTFNFPEGTVFDREENSKPVEDELYLKHKDIIENHDNIHVRRKSRKLPESQYRRATDNAPMMREGKPYGRRHDD